MFTICGWTWTTCLLQGLDLPSRNDELCAVALEDDRIMFLGGYGPRIDERTTWLYDTKTKKFTDGPKMNHARYFLGCAIFKSQVHGGRSVVLAAGGDQISAEIWDYTSDKDSWELSN